MKWSQVDTIATNHNCYAYEHADTANSKIK